MIDLIRKAEANDLEEILRVYRAAKAFMVAVGNPTQWKEGYPASVLGRDLERRQLYVVCDDGGAIHGAFVLAMGEDPAYQVIEDGAWGSDEAYGTIHRLGSDGVLKGVFAQCVEFCKGKIHYIRADTHRENLVMQHLLEKQGFTPRGIIYVEDGTPRIAYDLLV